MIKACEEGIQTGIRVMLMQQISYHYHIYTYMLQRLKHIRYQNKLVSRKASH